MLINFYKYHGAGNDFILMDNRNKDIELSDKEIQYLCHRNFGIGSDGLIFLENSKIADFKMRFYNPDGSEGMMCGNGGRCIVRFANDLEIINDRTSFEAPDGLHQAEIVNENIQLSMSEVSEINKKGENLFLNTGAPHCIVFVNDVSNAAVVAEGAKIRYSNDYAPLGTNVNFVEILNEGIKIRTYERGVENETLACGTGIVASALASHKKVFQNKNSIRVEAKGGDLEVRFDFQEGVYKNILLIGPAKFVFKGKVDFK